jgi:hypothetical protein
MVTPYDPNTHIEVKQIIMCRLKTPVIAADGKTEIIEPGSTFYGEGFKDIIYWHSVVTAHGIKATFALNFSNKNSSESLISYSPVTSVVETPTSPLLPFTINFQQDLDFSGFLKLNKNGDIK